MNNSLIGKDLMRRIAETRGIPLASVREVAADLLEEVVADLRCCVDYLNPDTDLRMAARTMAVRIEHAAQRLKTWRDLEK